MPGLTPIYGLRYPIGSDRLDDAISTIPQLNAQDVESTIAGFGGIASPGSWITPTLEVGSNFGGGYQAVKYRKVGTTVKIRGVLGGLGGGLGAGVTIFTLPAGFRPLAVEAFSTLFGTTPGQIEITAAGVVKNGTAVPVNAAVLFSGIEFDID